MLALIGAMAAAHACRTAAAGRRPLSALRRRLKTVHNRSRWGRSLQLQCLRAPRRLPDVRPVPARKRACSGRCPGSIGPSCCATAAGSTASTAAPRSARTTSAARTAARCRACSTSPGWRVRSTRTKRSGRTRVHALRARSSGAAMRGLRRARCRRARRSSCSQCGATLAIPACARPTRGRRRSRRRCARTPSARRRSRQAPARCARGDLPRRREWVRRDGSRGRQRRGAAASRVRLSTPARARHGTLSRGRCWRWRSGSRGATGVERGPAASGARRAMTATLYALGAIALWATLASLGVALAHLPPFLLTGLALHRRQRAGVAAGRQWRRAARRRSRSASTACSAFTSCSSSRCAMRRRSRPTSSTTCGRCSSSCWRRCCCPACRCGRCTSLAALLGFAGAALAIVGGREPSGGGFVWGYCRRSARPSSGPAIRC